MSKLTDTDIGSLLNKLIANQPPPTGSIKEVSGKRFLKHTYDHMISEYQRVWPLMREGGLFMSEDTHQNDAWGDFFANKPRLRTIVFNSHEGFDERREVSGTRVTNKE